VALLVVWVFYSLVPVLQRPSLHCNHHLCLLLVLQLVLRSRALEIAVEGCIASPLSSDETNGLQQLLSTFLPRADTPALASAIARLSELLAEDAQSFDTVGAAQRAVHNVISTLKAAKEGSEAAAGRPASLQVRTVDGTGVF